MNDQHTPDDDLRRLIHDAADGIRPQGTFDDILDRTKKVDPMARRWFLPVMAAAAVMAFVIGGAVWIAKDSNTPKDGGPLGNGTPTPTTSATEIKRAAPAYFVGQAAQGPRLYREFRVAYTCPTADCLATSSVFIALTGPEDRDYSSLWPADKTDGLIEDDPVKPHYGRTTASFDNDILTINLYGSSLAERPATMTAAQAELAVQQLIYSAQAGLGKGRVPVQILINEGHTPTVLGVPASEPLAAADELDVLAPVQISSPSEGATVKAGPVKVEGVAATYEANVVWEVILGGDQIIKEGHTMAQECCKLTPYSFTVDLVPGTYTIVVHDSDESGEGRPVNQDTKEIVVE